MKRIKCISCGKTFPPKWGTLDLEKHASGHKFKGFELIEDNMTFRTKNK